jgi:hypothetical protein
MTNKSRAERLEERRATARDYVYVLSQFGITIPPEESSACDKFEACQKYALFTKINHFDWEDWLFDHPREKLLVHFRNNLKVGFVDNSFMLFTLQGGQNISSFEIFPGSAMLYSVKPANSVVNFEMVCEPRGFAFALSAMVDGIDIPESELANIFIN